MTELDKIDDILKEVGKLMNDDGFTVVTANDTDPTIYYQKFSLWVKYLYITHKAMTETLQFISNNEFIGDDVSYFRNLIADQIEKVEAQWASFKNEAKSVNVIF